MLLRICCNTPPWESHYFLICFVQLPKVALATTGVRSPKLSVASPKHTHPSKNVTFSEIVAMRKSNECVKRAVWYVRELLARAATETDAGWVRCDDELCSLTAAAAAVIFDSVLMMPSTESCKWADWVVLDACWLDDGRSRRVNERTVSFAFVLLYWHGTRRLSSERHLAEPSRAGCTADSRPVGADLIRSCLHVIKTTTSTRWSGHFTPILSHRISYSYTDYRVVQNNMHKV